MKQQKDIELDLAFLWRRTEADLVLQKDDIEVDLIVDRLDEDSNVKRAI